MPNNIDINVPSTMTTALNKRYTPHSWITVNVFNGATPYVHETKDFYIDIKQGSRRMASFVSRKIPGKVVDKRGYATEKYQPPYIKHTLEYTADDMYDKRDIGSSAFDPKNYSRSFADRLADDQIDVIDMIERRTEWMAMKAITAFEIVAAGEGVTDTITFPNLATHKITNDAADRWDAATGDPLAQLAADKRLITKDAGNSGEVIILMGSDALNAFLGNAIVQKKLDILNYDVAKVEPRMVEATGAQYWGTIKGVGEIWEYLEWYIDPADGVEKSLYPSKSVTTFTKSGDRRLHYGAISNMKAMMSNNGASKLFVNSTMDEKGDNYSVDIHSAPLPVPHDINTIVTRTVLA